MACVGLGVTDETALDDLLTRALDDSDVVGRPGAVETRRWADRSGAMLTVVRRGEDVVDLVPSFQGQAGADLGELKALGSFAVADLREHGVMVGRIACHLPQGPYLPRVPVDVVVGAITALGVDVTVHADADAFAASEQSLLGGGTDGGSAAESEPEDGPARMAAESILPYGLFADDPADVDPVAFVAGTVVVAETRTNTLTGQSFHAMLLRTVGCTVTLCLAVADHPEMPPVGSIVAGACYLVADVPSLWKVQPKPKRAWLKHR